MTLTPLLAAVMVSSLVLYVLLAGADYGAGFWDLLSSGPSKEEQKNLIANAIRPIWEANHVWLILILVLLFAGFPRAFGVIMTALCVPISLMLLGIVLRGSSFVFRAYSTANSGTQRTYAYVFSASSSFTPIFAGIVLASLSDNRVVVAQSAFLNHADGMRFLQCRVHFRRQRPLARLVDESVVPDRNQRQPRI